jgi:chromosome segregation ATPase
MSQSESSDVRQRLYVEVENHIVQQCLQHIQTQTFLSTLNLDSHIQPLIDKAVQQSSSSEQAQELEQQISFTQQMIDVLQGALQDHRDEIDVLTEHTSQVRAENEQLKAQVERLHTKSKQLEKENASFRVEIANNRTFILDRLNALQEDVDRMQ